MNGDVDVEISLSNLHFLGDMKVLVIVSAKNDT